MRNSKKGFRWKSIVFPMISIGIFLIIWHIGVTYSALSKVLSGPIPVIRKFIDSFVNPIGKHTLFVHILWSLKRVLPAYIIGSVAGIILGILMGWYEVINAIFRPIYHFIRSIPPIAWIPLSILWFGIGESSKYFLIFLAGFMPIVLNCYSGVVATDPTLIKCSRMLGASDRQIFTTIVIPASVPHIFAGLQVGLSGSWATIVAAEMIRSSEGVGWIIVTSQETNNSVQMLVGIIAIGIVGFVLAVFMRKMEDILCRWNKREI